LSADVNCTKRLKITEDYLQMYKTLQLNSSAFTF
jgi:hypothetical protein